MAKGYKRRSKYKQKAKQKKVVAFFSVVIALFLSAYLLISVSEELNFKYIPTMAEVESYFGISDTNKQVESDCSIHFIDVGQGDSALIISNDKTILIDAGELEQGTVVSHYLKNLDIKKIDFLIATHPHSDHIGGMATIIDEFDIGKILMPRLPDNMVPTSKTYTRLLTSIANKGLKITPSKPGMAYDFGKGRLEVLGPTGEFEDLNDMSLVAKFTYDKDESFLFTGDMEKFAEKDLLNTRSNLDSDVLKVGHHGSNTSTHKAFYDAVSPEYCIISVADENKYNHPHQTTINRIKESKTKLFRTDFDGNIVFHIINDNFKITTTGINP